MATTTTSEPIPLRDLTSPAEDHDAAPNPGTVAQNDTDTANSLTTVPSVPSAQDQTTTSADRSQPPPPSAPTRSLNRVQSFARGAGFTNSIGTIALIAAVVFGIGAWVGMKIQISQGGKNMDLAIWTACADHEAIQDTALCKSILAKDFSEYANAKRDTPPSEKDVQLVKRELTNEVAGTSSNEAGEIVTGEHSTKEEKEKPQEMSRYGKLLSGLSSTDRAFVHVDPRDYAADRYQPDPALRATFLPVVNLLMKPITGFFEFIEYMFLVVIYFMHKIFSWIATAFIFLLQAMIYSFFDNLVRSFLRGLDLAILELLPEWVPHMLFSDIASVICLTGLRSYWYSSSYLTSLKWIVILRVCIWAIFFTLGIIIPFLWQLWQASRQPSESRVSNSTFPSLPNIPSKWFQPKAAVSAISSSFSSPNSLPVQQDSSVAPKAQVFQRGPARDANQRSKEAASAEELFYQSFGQPKSRGARAGVGEL